MGCQLQATTLQLLRNPQKEDESDSLLPKTPLKMLQQMMFSLAGHVGKLVRVTWSWVSSNNNNNNNENIDKLPGKKLEFLNSI